MEAYKFFVRTLDEMYADAEKRKIITPATISQGEFADLSYQIDAIRQGLECLEKYSGVMIADVVGLGKSIIATALAYNLAMPRTLIVAPPHLKPQWIKYVEKFQLKNASVVSSGKIKDLQQAAETAEPTLYIIDEAHRYRNENTSAYQLLHQAVRAKAENKVILLTATPYNNHPKDLYALVKLFQIPSRATLNTVDNFGLRFGQLIVEYNQLAKVKKRNTSPAADKQIRDLAERMRTILEPVIIRRSRIDLTEITHYAEDLATQKVSFANVNDPKTIEYDLGQLTERYYRTLEGLNTEAFAGAKYKPLTYLADEAEFNTKYKTVFNFSRTQQLNMAKLAQRLFVLRFESSPYAFKTTLEKMIAAHRNTIELWRTKGLVTISKNKALDKFDDDEGDNFTISRAMLNDDFVEDVEADLAWLEKIYQLWFKNGIEFDPKQARVELTIRELLRQNPERKIVIFTSFADTAEYVARKLREAGLTRTLLYTSAQSRALKNIVARNFDAALRAEDCENGYDIIVATDALSEGFNLHRAGVIINYDIPYNPTRVIQRVGRINRIDQQKFKELEVYNLFPTTIGENIIKVKGISSLKVMLMNQVIGNDTKVLTSDEEVESFLCQQYESVSPDKIAAWDNEYRNIYNRVKDDAGLICQVRSRSDRKITRGVYVADVKSLALIRRGNNLVFMSLGGDGTVNVVTPAKALEILCAEEDKKAIASDEKNESWERFTAAVAKPYELPKMLGNRGYALDVIEALREICPDEKTYLDKLYDAARRYDDLCEAELQTIVRLDLNNMKIAMAKLRTEIPEWYLDGICQKAAGVEAARPELILVEDFV